jgi:hypothetical protein
MVYVDLEEAKSGKKRLTKYILFIRNKILAKVKCIDK